MHTLQALREPLPQFLAKQVLLCFSGRGASKQHALAVQKMNLGNRRFLLPSASQCIPESEGISKYRELTVQFAANPARAMPKVTEAGR